MVEKFTEEEITAFRKTFQVFDLDRDGVVTIGEAALIMREHDICISQSELEHLVYQVCKRRSWTVDFPHFLAIMSEKYFKVPEDEDKTLRGAFRVFDREGNGYISCQDLHRIMVGLGERLTPEEADRMILEADTDHDGQISINEFLELLSQNDESPPPPGYYRGKSQIALCERKDPGTGSRENTFMTRSDGGL